VAVDLALSSVELFSAHLEFVYVIDVKISNRFGTVDASREQYLAKMEGQLFLEHVKEQADQKTKDHTETLIEGVPWEVICTKSEEADMMIMPVSGKTGMRPGHIGSTAKKVIENCHCPVLTLKSASNVIKEIMLPVYDENLAAIDVAIQTAKLVDGKITVISILEKGHQPQELVDSIVSRIKGEGIEADGLVCSGDVVDTIVGKSGLFDLIVMGVDQRSGLQAILHGGVAERVVTMSSCPVTVVRKLNRVSHRSDEIAP
jgi:nucleotide-binding universal stress UspA family protein